MWWEKTVEYKYILSKVIPKMHLAPMDGHHEALCDTVLSMDDKWLLIEFKRDKYSISSEIGKFPPPCDASFLAAKEILENYDNHHLIIYGIPAGAMGMELEAITYFSNRQIPIDQATDFSCSLNHFNDYIEEYLSRKFDEDVRSGSRGLDFGIVLAISEDGTISSIRSLSDHCLVCGLVENLFSDLKLAPSTKTGLNLT